MASTKQTRIPYRKFGHHYASQLLLQERSKRSEYQYQAAAHYLEKPRLDGTLNEYKIYRAFLRRDRRVDFIPGADVMQEIRLTLLQLHPNRLNLGEKFTSRRDIRSTLDGLWEVPFSNRTLKKCRAAIHRLLFAYGYSRNQRASFSGRREVPYLENDKGEIVEHSLWQKSELTKQEQLLANKLLNLWESGKTAKEIAEMLEITNLQHQHKIEHAFSRYFPKQAGKGGKRKGAGRINKKGSISQICKCTNCHKTQHVPKVKKSSVYKCRHCKQKASWPVKSSHKE